MRNELCGVYVFRNLRNGKVYVGSTVKGFERRKKQHLRDLKKGRHRNARFQHAWNKHGGHCFVFEVLVRCRQEDTLKFEQQALDDFKAADRKHGYNLLPVAGNSLGWVHSEETRQRLKQSWDDNRVARTAINKRVHSSVEARRRKSVIAKEVMNRPEVRARVSAGQLRPETRLRKSVTMKALYADPVVRAKIGATTRITHARPEVKQRISERTKAALANPEMRVRLSTIQRELQNRPDIRAKNSIGVVRAKLLPRIVQLTEDLEIQEAILNWVVAV